MNTIRKWKAIVRPAISEAGKLWFPQRLNYDFLEQQRRTLGPYLYSAQYLLQYIAPEDRRFEPDWIQTFKGKLITSEGYHGLIIDGKGFSKTVPVFVSTTVDPAISDDKKGDYTAIVTVATDPAGTWYILSARRFRGGANRVIEEVLREIREFSPAIVGIETVAYQKAIKEFLVERLRLDNIYVGVKELQSTVGRGKKARIEGLVPKLASKTVYFYYALGPELEKEILSWSPSQELPYDDLIDALSFQLEVAVASSPNGQRVLSGNWHDLTPDDRHKIKTQQAAAHREYATGLRTGYE